MGSQAPPVDLRDPFQGLASGLSIVPQPRRNAFWQTASDAAGLLRAEHWAGGEDN
jgi:hypothetical protein